MNKFKQLERLEDIRNELQETLFSDEDRIISWGAAVNNRSVNATELYNTFINPDDIRLVYLELAMHHFDKEVLNYGDDERNFYLVHIRTK